MILGKIIGKTTTGEFKFRADKDVKIYEYIQVPVKDKFVLAQITKIERDSNEIIAYCSIIGYKEGFNLTQIRTPLEPGTEVLQAEEDFIRDTLGLTDEKGAYIGKLDGKNLKVFLDINKMLTKHVNVIAKSGSGKSFATSCLIEELLDKRIPVLILDPHGEYSTLKFPNPDKTNMEKFDIEPKSYLKQILEYTPDTKINTDCKPLRLSTKDITPSEILQLLPAKLSNAQKGLLYSAIKSIGGKTDFDEIIMSLETEENSAKWTLINVLEYVQKLRIFSESPTYLEELIQPGKASIINLKGIQPELSEVVAYKLLKDLFEARKQNKVLPFFLVVEEAHNFAPERGFGEAKSSPILRLISAEGRKFGLGLCAITQRSAKLDKNIISQATTQIILKVTNPNDIKAITSSIEGLTSQTEKEISNIPIGTAMIVGVVNTPLLVNIRPRKSKHGGEAVNIMQDADFTKEADDSELMPVIKPKLTKQDIELMSTEQIKDKIKTEIIPIAFVTSNDYNLIVNLNNNQLITNIERLEGIEIPNLDLSQSQLKVFKAALSKKEFTPAELFASLDTSFSEINDIVNVLEKEDYLFKDKKFRVAPKYKLFSELEKYASYEKIEFTKMNFDKKLDKKISLDEVKRRLGKLLDIHEIKEAFLVNYRISGK